MRQSWAAQEIRRLDAEVSRLRTARASALARAEAAEAEAARRPTAHQLADMEGQRDAAEADAKEAQAALDMQRDALQAMTDLCNAAERERDEARAERDARIPLACAGGLCHTCVACRERSLREAIRAERERVRALEEGLREVDEAFTADRKARRPHNARLHARVKALLAPTKETTTDEPVVP